MGLSFNEIPNSNRLSPLDIAYDELGETNKKGIRAHNALSNLVLSLLLPLGVKKVVNIKNKEGNTVHLNKESLNKWLSRHHYDLNKLNELNKDDQWYIEAIKTVSSNARREFEKEKLELLKETKAKVESFTDVKLKTYQQCEIEGKKNETIALVDEIMATQKEGYHVEGGADGFIGRHHSVVASSKDKNGKKIFGGAGMKIHISIDPTIPGNRLKALRALEPILAGPNGVVQYKIYCESSEEKLRTWFMDTENRPGGQQGKEITLYLVDEQQIQKAQKEHISKENIEEARKFIKTPEQIACLIKACLQALKDANVEDIGYLKNVSDKCLDRSVGIRDDRKADGTLDDKSYIGEHAHGNYVNGVPQWEDPADRIIEELEK